LVRFVHAMWVWRLAISSPWTVRMRPGPGTIYEPGKIVTLVSDPFASAVATPAPGAVTLVQWQYRSHPKLSSSGTAGY
jgi:hypothetical protein